MESTLFEGWRLNAACLDLRDPEIMFPVAEDASTPLSAHELEVAKRVCRFCPARPDCLEWALDTGQDYGVWGGLSSPERRALSRERVVQ